MINAAGRDIPEYIEGYGKTVPYQGAFAMSGRPTAIVQASRPKSAVRGESKLCASIDEVLDKLDLHDGMTFSFHHHLRNGDYVTNMVMLAIAKRGIKDIHLAATGLFACHDPLVPLIEDGTITRISLSTIGQGGIAKAISAGKLKTPCVFYSHGGRACAVENGRLHVDVAFIAAPTADPQGNMNGCTGKSACGCLSYNHADAEHADRVVAITDNLVPYPCCPAEVTENFVDYVVAVDSIGDPAGIVSGATQITTNPDRLAVADLCAELLDKAGYIKDGMNFQTGAGGISLAVAAKIRDRFLAKGIRGGFGSGGITSYFVDMLHEGLLRALWDVQCFDQPSIDSVANDPAHMVMSGSHYGSPENKGCVANSLDAMILGAFEVDTDYNINVITGSNGIIMSAAGGNPDTAAGAGISIVASMLMKKGPTCFIKKAVTTVTTPGETVDAVVTDYGIAINPLRTDLLEALKDSGLPLVTIEELQKKGEELGDVYTAPNLGDKIVGVVEYRDGTVIDVVRQVL